MPNQFSAGVNLSLLLIISTLPCASSVTVAAVIENHDIRTGSQLEDVLPLALFFGVLISMFVGLILDVILKPKVGHRHRFRWAERGRPAS